MDLFLTLSERQMKLLDIGENLWVPYLTCALSSDVTSLIIREPEVRCREYSHIRGMLLQRFKLTAEKFRKLFSRHRKSPNGTWKEYYFEIRAYFEGWLNELKCNGDYLAIWEELISNEMLADKLKAFDNIRLFLPSGPRRHVKASETFNDGNLNAFLKGNIPILYQMRDPFSDAIAVA
ncbi:uncharacterized protein TNCV_1559461 [Trichonephila clavipes]|nr:uncharacterized protein TNCV_1559461 [Trichonephila clavipes]